MDEIIVYEGDYSVVPVESFEEAYGAFLAAWLDGKGEKTQKDYTADMRRFYAVTGKAVRDIRVEDVLDFKRSMEHLAPATQSRRLAAVKSALSYAKQLGYIEFNPGPVVKLPKGEDTLAERILSEKQVARMFAMETNPRNHAILVLLYRAGLRVSELCGLQWRNLQERGDAGQITVFGKGKKTGAILLDRETWEELLALREEGDGDEEFVFKSRQEHSRTDKNSHRLDPSTVTHIVRDAGHRAGIKKNVSPHWLRHCHATHALENGAPTHLVKETLRHRKVDTTMKYSHVRPGDSSTKYLKV